MGFVAARRRIRRAGRRLRETRMLVRSLRTQYQPVAAHLIPIRRCNIACGYCNEYDDRSAPVPTEVVIARVDRLALLGTGVITLSGGEPLLHPDLDVIVRRIRDRGVIATLITNGYLLSRDRIGRLNRAGLDHLQISIDNLVPDPVSMKSLRLLDQKLRWLAEGAEFEVTVNSVVGAGIANPDDALTIARRARELGFSTTVGIIHDHRGGLLPLDERQRAVVEAVVSLGQSAFDFATYNRFQRNLADGKPNQWSCRAGCRYLYVCEDGLVHWCSQQRGVPGIALEQYGPDDLHREYHRVKSCAPFCTVGCVHRVAQIDDLRGDPQTAVAQWFPARTSGGGVRMPTSVAVLHWAFVANRHREVFRRMMSQVFAAAQVSSASHHTNRSE